MKISEMIYELRKMAKSTENLSDKYLFYRAAMTLGVLGNIAKIGDLIVGEMKNCKKDPDCKDESYSQNEWPISEESILMIDEFLDELVMRELIDNDSRWPYGCDDLKFTKEEK